MALVETMTGWEAHGVLRGWDLEGSGVCDSGFRVWELGRRKFRV